MPSVRTRILNKLSSFKKGSTFTVGQVYSSRANNFDTARRRVGELVEEGLIVRLKPGLFKVTSTAHQRKALLS